MAIVIICPKCSTRLKAGEDRAGKTVACPKCKEPISVPAPSTSPLPAWEVVPSPLPPESPVDSLPLPTPSPIPASESEEKEPAKPKRRRDEDEEEPKKSKKKSRLLADENGTLVIISWILIVVGLSATFAGLVEGTTVDSYSFERIHNIGLIAYKQLYLFGGLITTGLGILTRMLSFLEAMFRISNRGS